MSWLSWVAATGGLLLVFAVASAYVRRGPASTSVLYLAVGVALGPAGAGVLELDFASYANLIEHVTEIAVLVALFTGGLRLRRTFGDRAWRAAFLLAGPVMIASIGLLAVVAHAVVGLPAPYALLLAAILAPTDPVLASVVTVEDASDEERVRWALSGEAGLNDGTAAPFVALALLWIHGGSASSVAAWFAFRVVWAVPAALALGYGLGRVVGVLAIHLRSRQRDLAAPNDFLALALIAISYVAAQWLGAWGFIAVFASGVGLRAAELKVVLESPHPTVDADQTIDNADHPPAEELVAARETEEAMEEPAVAAGVLVSDVLTFGDTIERLVELGLVLAVGAALAAHWDVRAIPVGLALFLFIRPLATVTLLRATNLTPVQRWLTGWFGVRGIGSLYYVALAYQDLAENARAAELVDFTISIVASSIVIHGLSTRPILWWYGRRSAVR